MISTSLPPSPPKHWFWGNKYILGQPHRHVLFGTKYKRELGDIISTVTLNKTNIYLNTMELATGLLDKHASVTSDRPHDVMIDLLGWGTSAAFRNHDEVHKKMRRVLASALHPTIARSYASQHLDTTMSLLREVASNPSSFVESTDAAIGSFTVRLAYGYTPKTQQDPMLFLVHDAVRYLATSFSHYWLVNDFPLLKHIPSWFPGANFQKIAQKGYKSRMRYADTLFNKVLEQVRKGNVEQPSYVSGLLESKGGADLSGDDIYLIKWTGASIFTAGSTTTSSLIKSFFLMACLYPEAAKKAQGEIDSVVGRERIPNLQDRPALPYTEAFVQEIMRMFPPAPLGLAHLTTEDIEFQGYQIPKGTTINANICAWITCAGLLSVFDIQAGPRLAAQVASLGGRESERLYELTEPFGAGDPLPFDCEIKPRDSAALSVLDNSS
ncbi:O-methylsterigmatocystin oxidoreductase [Rhizoctonia solani]|uniref:O-methylsterigmatocystin oxidoreductase n=1 Tax=Rhizoctonia solani TaxID=456999 RepID=A0A0K6G4I8_9AGAM|nr:O-methylsterigmatocystin oxidoreductase [Rhizoctonia solani]